MDFGNIKYKDPLTLYIVYAFSAEHLFRTCLLLGAMQISKRQPPFRFPSQSVNRSCADLPSFQTNQTLLPHNRRPMSSDAWQGLGEVGGPENSIPCMM